MLSNRASDEVECARAEEIELIKNNKKNYYYYSVFYRYDADQQNVY